ncbi:MAG: OmpA family protein [Candidatus Zixiibacteriota bacterium]|nr:MAG: OmpA family protein [candidate division Zixibacteria bacterium]
MKSRLLLLAVMLLMIAGCGVNEDFVGQQILESEARDAAKMEAIRAQADANAAELTALRNLATELESKADMALNEAKGFENYQIIWEGEVNFAYDSYEIDDIAAQILNDAGAKMEAYPGSLAEFVGHTDATGTAKYNIMLGEKRAGAARRYLADNYGISLYRMFVLSYGEEKPVALPDERDANSRNRRVKVRIWGNL